MSGGCTQKHLLPLHINSNSKTMIANSNRAKTFGCHRTMACIQLLFNQYESNHHLRKTRASHFVTEALEGANGRQRKIGLIDFYYPLALLCDIKPTCRFVETIKTPLKMEGESDKHWINWPRLTLQMANRVET